MAFMYSFTQTSSDTDVTNSPVVMVDFSAHKSSSTVFAKSNKGTARQVEKTTPVKPLTPPAAPKPVETVEEVKPTPTEVKAEPIVDEVVDTKVLEETPTETVDETAEEVVVEPTKPAVEGMGSGAATKESGSGSTSGEADDEGAEHIEAGEGEHDASGKGIFGRRVIKRNYAKLPMTESGLISIKTCIDRNGRVTHAEIIEDETSIMDKDIWKKTIKACKGYIFEKDLKAPAEQCGILRIFLEVKV